MPRVPTVDGLSVEQRPLPAPRQESIASPAMFAAAGAALERGGAQLADAGEKTLAVAAKMQEDVNLEQVQTAHASYLDGLLKFTTEAKEKRVLAGAGGLTNDFDKWHEKSSSEIANTLTNDAQRRAFKVLAGKSRLSGRHDVATFEIGETRKAEVAANTALQNTLTSAGAVAGTDTAAQEYKGQLVSTVKVFSARNNFTPEMEAAALTQATTKFHIQRLQQIQTDNPKAASEYFEKYKQEIDGAQHAEIGRISKQVSAAAIGEESAERVFTGLGPKDDRTPVQLDVMENALRAELKGNEPALDQAIKRLRERASAFKDARKERDDGREAEVNKMILGGATRAQIAASPAFNALSPESARKIDTFMENKEYSRISRAAALENLADAQERRRERRVATENFGAYLKYHDPSALASMTANEVTNLLPVLGRELTLDLVKRHEALTKDGRKLREARMDKQDFDKVADELGLKPFDPTKNEEQKRQLGVLQYRIEQVIDAEQSKLKRELTREEKQVLFRREMAKTVLFDEPWYTPRRDSERPAITIPEGDLSRVVVPAADKEAIITEYKKRNGGKEPKPEDVARFYLRAAQGAVWAR